MVRWLLPEWGNIFLTLLIDTDCSDVEENLFDHDCCDGEESLFDHDCCDGEECMIMIVMVGKNVLFDYD